MTDLMKTNIIYYFFYFFSLATLITVFYNENYRIALLINSETINGKIETCDSVNTDMGMNYIYNGSFIIDNKTYKFRKDPVGEKEYKIGETVKLKYSPKNPSENIVETFSEKYYIIYTIILMLSIFATTLYLHRRSIKKNN